MPEYAQHITKGEVRSHRHPPSPAVVLQRYSVLLLLLEFPTKSPQQFGGDSPDRVNLLIQDNECKWKKHQWAGCWSALPRCSPSRPRHPFPELPASQLSSLQDLPLATASHLPGASIPSAGPAHSQSLLHLL